MIEIISSKDSDIFARSYGHGKLDGGPRDRITERGRRWNCDLDFLVNDELNDNLFAPLNERHQSSLAECHTSHPRKLSRYKINLSCSLNFDFKYFIDGTPLSRKINYISCL